MIAADLRERRPKPHATWHHAAAYNTFNVHR
jgi:hypothetical protein